MNCFIFYAHNLGRFDGFYLIRTLFNAGFKIKPIIKEDNTILALEITTTYIGGKI